MSIGTVSNFFTATWTVIRYAPVRDTMGGFSPSSSSAGTVSGMMRPLSGHLKLSADKDHAFATHRLYCAPTSIITAGRYLTTGGSKYEVKFVSNVMNMGRLMQVDCEVVG